MPARDYQKIYDEALKLLEDRPYVMLSYLGERVKTYMPKDLGLLQVIGLSDHLEVLRDQDPSKAERVAVCKKEDIEAKKAFEKKFNRGAYSPPDLLRSVLCAFCQSTDGERAVFLENKFPFKFKVTSQHPAQGQWIEIPENKRIQKDGDFGALSDDEFSTLVANIKTWCTDNGVNFDSLFRSYRKYDAGYGPDDRKGQQLLSSFLDAQHPDVRSRIVFPAEFISFLIQNKK